MDKEIKRNSWSKFCRKFSSDNQYRGVTIKFVDRHKKVVNVSDNLPFLGLALTKNGRLIDGFELFSEWGHVERVAAPVAAIKEPSKVKVGFDKNGRENSLVIESKDGSRLDIALTGEADNNRHRYLVEKVAYSMYEQRGYTPGSHESDWLEAERMVRETESQFV